MGEIPYTEQMAASLQSSLIGPQIGRSFNLMGNVITSQTAYLVNKGLKYSLRVSDKTAVPYFKKKYFTVMCILNLSAI